MTRPCVGPILAGLEDRDAVYDHTLDAGRGSDRLGVAGAVGDLVGIEEGDVGTGAPSNRAANVVPSLREIPDR